MAFSPYSPEDPVHRHRLHLPHWRQWGGSYFISTRLADSLPSKVRDDWVAQRNLWLAHHGYRPEVDPHELPEELRHGFHREFTAKFHELLDAGHGVTYRLDAWVVMPNHFHALVEPMGNTTLGEILKRWKGVSARKINQACNRSGSLWQAEAFDHIVRSEAQFQHFRRYIANNPLKAELQKGYVLGFGNEVGLSREDLLAK